MKGCTDEHNISLINPEYKPLEFNSSAMALRLWLDLFRWTAAVAVLISHVRHRLFVPISDMPAGSKTFVFYLLGGLSSFGPPSVIIFFVLSGFLVGGSSLKKYRLTNKFYIYTYILSRLTRLWIVIIPTLGITYALSRFSKEILNYNWEGSSDIGFWQLACNTFFLQTAFCKQYGGNGALWSLFHEFWYYITWPLVMIAFFSKVTYLQRLIRFGAAILVLGFLTWHQTIGPNLIVYFSIWLLGVWASEVRGALLCSSLKVSLLIFMTALMIWRISTMSSVQGQYFWREFPADFLIGLAFANLVVAIKNRENQSLPPLSVLNYRFAAFSFTLYCIHTPIINFIRACLASYTRKAIPMVPVGYWPYALCGVAVSLCVALAYVTSLMTERNTVRLRKWIITKFE